MSDKQKKDVLRYEDYKALLEEKDNKYLDLNEYHQKVKSQNTQLKIKLRELQKKNEELENNSMIYKSKLDNCIDFLNGDAWKEAKKAYDEKD